MVFTSKAVARRSHHGHNSCHLSSGSVAAHMALCRDHSRTDLALRHSRAVGVELRSGRLDSGHVEVVGSRPPAVRDVVAHSDLREGPRSSRVVVECGDDNHRGVGCIRVVDHGGRSSHHHQLVGRSRGRGSLASGNGSAREDVGRPFGADIVSARGSHARGELMDLHQRCSERSRP